MVTTLGPPFDPAGAAGDRGVMRGSGGGFFKNLTAAALTGIVLTSCSASSPPMAPPELRAAEPSPSGTEADPVAALRRPLDLPSLPLGGGCPVTRGMQEPDPALGPILGDGQVGPVGIPSGVLAYQAPGPDTVWAGQSWGGQKVLWAVDDALDGPVLIRGHQLDGPLEVRFENAALPELVSEPGYGGVPGGWRDYPSYTRLRAPGCYAYQVDTATGSTIIVFRATGPTIPPPPGEEGASPGSVESAGCYDASDSSAATDGVIRAGPFKENALYWTQPQGTKFWIGSTRPTKPRGRGDPRETPRRR